MTEFLISTPGDVLLAESDDALDAIRTAAGFSEVQFDRIFLPVLRQYARYVQRLPLHSTYFNQPGGAWQFGLTLSVLTLRVAGTRMFFPSLDSEARRVLEPQCRFAAFAAGLASGVAILAQSAKVMDGEDEYHPLTAVKPLGDWLTTVKTATFAWRTTEQPLTQPECAAISAMFLPRGLLTNFDVRISLMICNSIFPPASASGIESTLAKVVRQSIEKTIDLHLAKMKETYTTPSASNMSLLADAAKAAATLTEAKYVPMEPNPLDAPASGAATSTPTSSPVQTASVSGIAGAVSNGDEAAAKMVSEGHPALQEWFIALTKHERYEDLKAKFIVSDAGIEIPATALGSFGMNGSTIKSYMEQAGMIAGKANSIRNILLSPILKPVLYGAST